METFQEFYNENKNRLFGYLLRRTGRHHIAADITQESFTRYIEKYGDGEYTPALLFTIGRNLLYDQSRKKQHRGISYEDELHSSEHDTQRAYDIKEEAQQVLDAMKKLEDEEREVLALVVSSGLSYREIAKTTGLSEANVKVKVHRARKKLKDMLSGK